MLALSIFDEVFIVSELKCRFALTLHLDVPFELSTKIKIPTPTLKTPKFEEHKIKFLTASCAVESEVALNEINNVEMEGNLHLENHIT